MKKTLLLVFSFLFILSSCSTGEYYTRDEVEEIIDEYEQKLSRFEGVSVPDADSIADAAYQSGYEEGRSGAYEEGYDDGYSAGYNDGSEYAREDSVWNTIHDYPEWLLDGDVTEFWGELYNALAAFWSGDTSDLTDFESGLYDVIRDIYGEYKADQAPDQTYTPDPDPPADQSTDVVFSQDTIDRLSGLKESLEEKKNELEENRKKLEEILNGGSTTADNSDNSTATPPPTQPTEPTPADPAPPTSYTVYITDTGTKYHGYGCRHLKNSCHPIDRNAAIAQNYTPCSVCNP